MKASPYNHFFPARVDGVILAYNTYSGALAEIETEHYARVLQLLASPASAETDQDRQFLQCLRDGQFLVPDAVDQLAALRSKSRAGRLEGTVLTLTIAPTLACNFECDYCYESRSAVRMSDETQDALVAFADRYLSHAEALRICWFGGEPTLCFALIERLQRRFMELAEKYRIKHLPGTIITNGYLMDAVMAQRLSDLGVTRAQITIDGPRPVHDSRRKLRNGQGSFDRILENLSRTADILKISVRINIDKGNVDSACEVVRGLRERGILPKVKVNFAQVTPSGSVCTDIRDRCHDDEEFSRVLVQIYDRLLDDGINQIDYPRVSAGAACGATAEGYYVVSPTGFLFKCWEDLSLDHAKSVGSIFASEPEDWQKHNLAQYTAWDPFTKADCNACSILPLCMAGCPVRGMEQAYPTKGACSSWKYNLREVLALAYAHANQDVKRP